MVKEVNGGEGTRRDDEKELESEVLSKTHVRSIYTKKHNHRKPRSLTDSNTRPIRCTCCTRAHM